MQLQNAFLQRLIYTPTYIYTLESIKTVTFLMLMGDAKTCHMPSDTGGLSTGVRRIVILL